MTRATYATVQGKTQPVRLAAQLAYTGDDTERMVDVWIVGGGSLGLYRLERFDGGKLTPKTLAALFAPAPKVTA